MVNKSMQQREKIVSFFALIIGIYLMPLVFQTFHWETGPIQDTFTYTLFKDLESSLIQMCI